MDSNDLFDKISNLIKNENDFRLECLKVMSGINDKAVASELQQVVTSKDRCILELNKILQLLKK